MHAATAPAAAAPAPLLSPAFLRAYAVTMRPYLLFVSGAAGIAGMSFGTEAQPASLLAIALAAFCSYGFGQALTDCWQTDTDALSSPYRPLVRGELRRRDVLLVSLAGLAAAGCVFTLHNPLCAPPAALAAAGLATYTPFKRRWWGGPFYNAWIVAALFAICLLAAGGDVARLDPARAGAWTAVFFGYAHFVLAGYFKDVSADRATGYRTLPVAAGLRVSAAVCDAFALLAAAGAAAVFLSAGARGPAPAAPAAFLVAGVAAFAVAQRRLHEVTDERDAHRAIAAGVHGYILLCACIAASNRPSWSPALALFFGAYLWTLSRRPAREQI